MWSTPIRSVVSLPGGHQEELNCLILDSEGSDSIGNFLLILDGSPLLDQTIFALCTLISSILVFNTSGPMCESHIELIGNMLKLVEQIVKTNNPEKGTNIVQEFPTFLWVLRDFGLDLGLISSADYLENSLTTQDGSKNPDNIMNYFKKLITQTFKKRGCFTLPRPLVNEKELQNIYSMSEEDLRPEFEQDLKSFLQFLSLNIRPKMLNNSAMTSSVLIGLLENMIQQFNEGGIPMINSIAETLFDSETNNVQRNLIQKIEDFIQQTDESLPIPQDKFVEMLSQFDKKILTYFKKASKLFSEERQSDFIKFEELLKNKLQKAHQDLHLLNKKASIAWAQTVLDQFICDYKLPNISNRESFKEDLLLNMKQKYSSFIEEFLATQTGSGALEKCLQTLPGFMI